ncbi:MAG: DUF3108 domain-containing protein [Bacteroidota bacterium]
MTRHQISILLLLFLAVHAKGQETAMVVPQPDSEGERSQFDACFVENQAFQPGEEVIYKLYYNWGLLWLSAGEVVFTVEEAPDRQYYLAAKGKTYPSYEWFFKVRDSYECYVEKESLLPSMSIRNVHEGKYRLYDKLTFDQSNKKVVSLRGNTADDSVRREFELEDCMHDILSIIYYTRNLDFNNFESGEEFPVKIFMDKEVFPLKVRYKGKVANKKIKGLGRFHTMLFSPEVIAGEVFDEDTTMSVWVSDDGNRVPLLIESPVSVGSVKAVLKSYKGLRYDLDAKID